MNDKELTYKIAQDTLNTTCDFILGIGLLLIISIPMFLLRHHLI